MITFRNTIRLGLVLWLHLGVGQGSRVNVVVRYYLFLNCSSMRNSIKMCMPARYNPTYNVTTLCHFVV